MNIVFSTFHDLVQVARLRECLVQEHYARARALGDHFEARRRLAATFESANRELLESERWAWAALTGGRGEGTWQQR